VTWEKAPLFPVRARLLVAHGLNSATWNSGSATTAAIAIFDLNTSEAWNDFALDDISLTTEPVKAEAKGVH
jgi:hypothetical protein